MYDPQSEEVTATDSSTHTHTFTPSGTIASSGSGNAQTCSHTSPAICGNAQLKAEIILHTIFCESAIAHVMQSLFLYLNLQKGGFSK